MTRFNIDFTNTEDKAVFPIVPEGDHVTTVTEVTMGTSKKGEPMFSFVLETREYGKLFLNCLNTEKNRWFLKRVIHGITGTLQPKGVIEGDTNDWLGCKLVVTVKHNEYNGKTYANVYDIILPVDNPNIDPKDLDTEVPF